MRRFVVAAVAGSMALMAGPITARAASDITPPYIRNVDQSVAGEWVQPNPDGSTTVTMNILFTLGDVDDPYESYVIQQSVDGGPFATISEQHFQYCGGSGGGETRFGWSVDRTVGHTYQTRIQGTDCHGNVGPWKTLPTRTLSGLQENAFTYTGHWSSVSIPDAWDGSVMQTDQKRATASITFTGTSFAIVTTIGPDYGAARQYFNGDYKMIRNGPKYFSTTTYRVIRRPTSHQFEIPDDTYTVSYTAKAPAGHPLFDVDGFVVWG